MRTKFCDVAAGRITTAPGIHHYFPPPTMYVPRSLWSIVFLCSVVCAGLTNYTLDDTSSDIIYTQTPLTRCSPTACFSDISAEFLNGTSSTTAAAIIVPFYGVSLSMHRLSALPADVFRMLMLQN